MARRLVSIICYVIAGFFVYMVCLLSFVSEVAAKYVMVGVFSTPAVAFLAAGLAISRSKGWRHLVGVVLLSGTGVAAGVVGMVFFLWLAPETRELFSTSSLDFFSDYLAGSVSILLLAALGGWLVISNRRANAKSSAPGSRTAGSAS
ncbi:MAG: hypothetical protein R3268_08540 [Acidiferrobacterales bacterium]|nr:hypothetical protein [Acidiferrobacterales bacterium]